MKYFVLIIITIVSLPVLAISNNTVMLSLSIDGVYLNGLGALQPAALDNNNVSGSWVLEASSSNDRIIKAGDTIQKKLVFSPHGDLLKLHVINGYDVLVINNLVFETDNEHSSEIIGDIPGVPLVDGQRQRFSLNILPMHGLVDCTVIGNKRMKAYAYLICFADNREGSNHARKMVVYRNVAYQALNVEWTQ